MSTNGWLLQAISTQFGQRARMLASGVLVSGVLFVGALSAMGCSDPAPVLPRVAVETTMKAASDINKSCNIATGPWMKVGTMDKAVEDGAEELGVPITVACAVRSEGEGFRVIGSASVRGSNAKIRAATIKVSGLFAPTGTQTAEIVFQDGDGNAFKQQTCTVTYPMKDQLQYGGVAAGRAWGEFECDNAPSTSGTPNACSLHGQFKFENCDQ